jgi:hypothetical protein
MTLRSPRYEFLYAILRSTVLKILGCRSFIGESPFLDIEVYLQDSCEWGSRFAEDPLIPKIMYQQNHANQQNHTKQY